MRVIGIDLSLTSPAICILDRDNPEDWTKSRTYYLTDKYKLVGKFGKNVLGGFLKLYKSEMERYENISEWAINILGTLAGEEVQVYLEDYSMGSKGRVFAIAENTGVLKYKLYSSHIPLETIPPTVVKKSFSGKGNSDKQMMYEAFESKFPQVNLKKLLGVENVKLGNPTTDIVDSFAVGLTGLKK